MATTPCTCDGGAQSRKLLKRKTTKKGDRENPYSERGVEKFSALLDEIEEKKRMIYSQFNHEEVSLIQFVHAGDNKLKPLVVRATTRNSKLASKLKEEKAEAEEPLEDTGDQEKEKKMEIIEVGAGNEEKKSLSMEVKLKKSIINQPWISTNYRVSGMVILVLLMAAVFGRYWKSYYLVQLQATVCPRIQTE